MDASLNIAIAAEFDLCEKIAEALEQSELDVGKISIVEIYPFEEEQAVRFRNKAVAQLATDEIEWDSINYLFFAGQIDQAPLLAQTAESGCVVIELARYKYEGKKKNPPAQPHNSPQKLTPLLAVLGE